MSGNRCDMAICIGLGCGTVAQANTFAGVQRVEFAALPMSVSAKIPLLIPKAC